MPGLKSLVAHWLGSFDFLTGARRRRTGPLTISSPAFAPPRSNGNRIEVAQALVLPMNECFAVLAHPDRDVEDSQERDLLGRGRIPLDLLEALDNIRMQLQVRLGVVQKLPSGRSASRTTESYTGSKRGRFLAQSLPAMTHPIPCRSWRRSHNRSAALPGATRPAAAGSHRSQSAGMTRSSASISFDPSCSNQFCVSLGTETARSPMAATSAGVIR